jgi:hypothetical protein
MREWVGTEMGDLDTVWRYMSFARFVWFLQKKRLWLSRVDKLDDEWELALAGDQLDHVILRRAFAPIGATEEPSCKERSGSISSGVK